jgi:hypothetical protein
VPNPGQDPAACACMTPPEVASGTGGDDHLVVLKDGDRLRIGSEDAAGAPSALLFGAGLPAGVIDHYNVYRGSLDTLADGYDHGLHDAAEGCGITADPVLDTAACGGAGCPGDGGNYYYLVAAECAAGDLEGPLGFGSLAPPLRDQPIDPPAPACP